MTIIRQLTRQDRPALQKMLDLLKASPEFNWNAVTLLQSFEDWELWAVFQDSKMQSAMALMATGDFFELIWIYTAPHARRQGHGQKLLQFWIDNAKRNGARLLLEVHEKNTQAQHLYAQLGFKRISERKNYYSDGATAWVYVLEIPAP